METLDSKFSEFKEVQDTSQLDANEFKVITLVYPAFLVGKADGHFDEKERTFMAEIIQGFLGTLPDVDEDSLDLAAIQEHFIKEIEAIADNQEAEQIVLQYLKNWEDENPDALNAAGQLLYEMAEASGGVSEEEDEMINTLKKEVFGNA